MIHVPMATKDNKGFFIRPPRELVNKLERAAQEFKKSSANQVAVEILAAYLDSWREIEQIRKDAEAAQHQRFEAAKIELLQQRLVPARAEPDTKSSAKRKAR